MKAPGKSHTSDHTGTLPVAMESNGQAFGYSRGQTSKGVWRGMMWVSSCS